MGGYLIKSKVEEPKIQAPVIDESAKVKKLEEERISKEIQFEKVSNELQLNAQEFRRKEMKLQQKIDKLKTKAKEYIMDGKQKEAKKLLQQATRVKKHLQQIEVRRKVIVNKKDDLQTHQLNMKVVEGLEAANKISIQDVSSQLEEHIITHKQNKVVLDQVNERLKQLVENSEDEEAADEMMKELEQQVLVSNKKKVQMKNPAISVSITTNANMNKKQVNKAANIDLDKMLAEL